MSEKQGGQRDWWGGEEGLVPAEATRVHVLSFNSVQFGPEEAAWRGSVVGQRRGRRGDGEKKNLTLEEAVQLISSQFKYLFRSIEQPYLHLRVHARYQKRSHTSALLSPQYFWHWLCRAGFAVSQMLQKYTNWGELAMLRACAQTCELCQMFAGAPFFFFSAELHLLLGQTTIISTLFEVRLNQYWLRTSSATSFTWSFGRLLLTRCHPPLSGGKTPTCLGWHHEAVTVT